MYATQRLTPASALRFLKLAPYELRPTLADAAALERAVVVGATLAGRPVGLAIAVRGWAEPTDPVAPPVTQARLLSLTVARSHRRLGVGRMLLTSIERALAALGVTQIEAMYAIMDDDARAAVDALFVGAGWSPPTVRMVQCRADEAVLAAPLMQEQMQLPDEYRIEDWVDLTAADRASIRDRQRDAAWFPPTLDPFRFEPEMEVHNSLALRYRGDIVGWLITFRTGPTTMFYRCMFARADLARLGRALALLCEAIRRHAALITPELGYGEWSTPASLPLMVRFIRRHLVPYGATITEQYSTSRGLTPSAPAIALPPRSPRAVSQHPMLSPDECARACAAVLALRDHWRTRAEALPGFTVGALTRRDGIDDLARYRTMVAEERDELDARFGWLYARLCDTLSHALGAPARLHPEWARPVVHITPYSRGATLPIAAVHCDGESVLLSPGEPPERPPMALMLCLSVPTGGAGLTTWALTHAETVGRDTDEIGALLAAAPQQTTYGLPGQLLLHEAQQYHQVTALSADGTGHPRITLEGLAVQRDGVWDIFG
jgi:GNAT superfamily N-acetyltransferase